MKGLCTWREKQEVADLLGISLRSYKSYENDKEKEGTIKYNYILDKLRENYCILFGSYAKGKAVGASDIDRLISSDVKGLKYYGMVEKLRNVLHKRIDALNVEQLKDNIEFIVRHKVYLPSKHRLGQQQVACIIDISVLE